MSIQSGWSGLWPGSMQHPIFFKVQHVLTHNSDPAEPILYLAIRTCANINNTLSMVVHLSTCCVAYACFNYFIGRRTRQTHHYSFIDGTPEGPAPRVLSSLARASQGNSRSTLYAKAIFNLALFVGIQWVIVQIMDEIASILALTYHDYLYRAAVVGLFCLIRGLKLHVDIPVRTRRTDATNYSPGFQTLQAKCRQIAQSALAVPITVVALHSRISRGEIWKHAWILFVLAIASLVIFLAVNSVALFVVTLVRWTVVVDMRGLIGFQDYKSIRDAMDGVGLSRKDAVLPLARH
ncbi:hypothetical protein GMOD_00003867 [Pyrenophora seminiperda CCB06]|uniref:Uncharacterized protein n=1 Tax=Pyrenophora seminiperda CCB06 TaxID=1302712 RepID=A0A3M7M053_9PLEO|nr:hypothetical protein GMOD_00003867 [Pyrenophora seminiperda CCB06]